MQANLIAYFTIFAGLPGITFVADDVTWFVNTNDGGPDNVVLRSRLAGDAIERHIDAVLHEVSRYTGQLDWLVFPGCQPADLGQRLESRGMPGGPGGTWMLADLTSLPHAPPAPDRLRIERVSSSDMLEQWQQVSSEGFGRNSRVFYDAFQRSGLAADSRSLHYIGYLDDRPVTSSTLLLAEGIAGLFDISTPPAFRRQGLAGAITQAMMLEAARRGYRAAWVWSSRMGRGVYSRCGFVAADFGIREYQWRQH